MTVILETAQSLPHEQRKAYAEKVNFKAFDKYIDIVYCKGCDAVLGSNRRR